MSDTGPLAEAYIDVQFRLDRLETDLKGAVQGAVNRVERSGAAQPRIVPKVDTSDLRDELVGVRALTSGIRAVANDQLDDVARRSNLAARALSQLGTAGVKITPGLLAGTAAVGGFAFAAQRGVRSFVNLADEVRRFSDLSGASTDTSSRFVAVLDDYGVSAQTGANSMFFLGRAVATNRDELERQGVQIAENADGTVNLAETFATLADSLAATNDPGRRAAAIQATLGRQGRELIPVLELGGKRIRELFEEVPDAELLDDNDLRQARAFELAMDDLGDALTGAARALGEGFVPAVAGLARGLTPAIREVGEFTETTVTGFAAIVEAVRNPTELFNPGKFVSGLRSVGSAADAVGSDFGALGEDIEDAAEKVDDFVARYSSFIDAQFGAVDAGLALASAQDALEDSGDRVVDAQERLADALNATGSAARRVVEAQRALRDSGDEVADAEASLADARDRFGVQSREAVEEERRVRAAREQQSDAARGVEEAERDRIDEIAEARENLSDATRGEREAAVRAAEANVRYREAHAEANREVFTAAQRADTYRESLDRIAATLAPGSPLRRYLQETADAIRFTFPTDLALPLAPGVAGPLQAGQARQAGPTLPTTTTAPAPTGFVDTNPNVPAIPVTTSPVRIEQNFYNQQDPLILATDTAWLLEQQGASAPSGGR